MPCTIVGVSVGSCKVFFSSADSLCCRYQGLSHTLPCGLNCSLQDRIRGRNVWHSNMCSVHLRRLFLTGQFGFVEPPGIVIVVAPCLPHSVNAYARWMFASAVDAVLTRYPFHSPHSLRVAIKFALSSLLLYAVTPEWFLAL